MDPSDPEKISEVVRKEFGKSFAGLKFDANLFEEVFDPEKADATCPACGTEFSTNQSECPECGLCFA